MYFRFLSYWKLLKKFMRRAQEKSFQKITSYCCILYVLFTSVSLDAAIKPNHTKTVCWPFVLETLCWWYPRILLKMDTKIIPFLAPIVFIDPLKLEKWRSKGNKEKIWFTKTQQTETSIGIHSYQQLGNRSTYTVCTYEK